MNNIERINNHRKSSNPKQREAARNESHRDYADQPHDSTQNEATSYYDSEYDTESKTESNQLSSVR